MTTKSTKELTKNTVGGKEEGGRKRRTRGSSQIVVEQKVGVQ